MSRLDRDHYFMAIALVAAQRSSCLKRQVGCVITINNRTLSTGYNGPPSEYRHCTSCARENVESGSPYYNCPAIHAEANAMVMALKNSHGFTDATMYCTLEPCFECLKLAMNCDIRKIVYNEGIEKIESSDYITGNEFKLYSDMVEELNIEIIKLTPVKK